MFGPCLNQVLPSTTSIPARTQKDSRLNQPDIRHIYIECLFLRPCQGYIWIILDRVWPAFTSRPARAPNVSRLSQHGSRHMILCRFIWWWWQPHCSCCCKWGLYTYSLCNIQCSFWFHGDRCSWIDIIIYILCLRGLVGWLVGRPSTTNWDRLEI